MVKRLARGSRQPRPVMVKRLARGLGGIRRHLGGIREVFGGFRGAFGGFWRHLGGPGGFQEAWELHWGILGSLMGQTTEAGGG